MHISPVYGIVQLPKVSVINVKYWKVIVSFLPILPDSDILDTYNEYFSIPTDVQSSESKGNDDDIFLTILTILRIRLLQYLIVRIIIRLL